MPAAVARRAQWKRKGRAVVVVLLETSTMGGKVRSRPAEGSSALLCAPRTRSFTHSPRRSSEEEEGGEAKKDEGEDEGETPATAARRAPAPGCLD